jgi:hypothetical protein
MPPIMLRLAQLADSPRPSTSRLVRYAQEERGSRRPPIMLRLAQLADSPRPSTSCLGRYAQDERSSRRPLIMLRLAQLADSPRPSTSRLGRYAQGERGSRMPPIVEGRPVSRQPFTQGSIGRRALVPGDQSGRRAFFRHGQGRRYRAIEYERFAPAMAVLLGSFRGEAAERPADRGFDDAGRARRGGRTQVTRQAVGNREQQRQRGDGAVLAGQGRAVRAADPDADDRAAGCADAPRRRGSRSWCRFSRRDRCGARCRNVPRLRPDASADCSISRTIQAAPGDNSRRSRSGSSMRRRGAAARPSRCSAANRRRRDLRAALRCRRGSSRGSVPRRAASRSGRPACARLRHEFLRDRARRAAPLPGY